MLEAPDPALGRAAILGRIEFFPASLAALWGPLRPGGCRGNGSILGPAKFSELPTSRPLLSYFQYYFLRKAYMSLSLQSVSAGRFPQTQSNKEIKYLREGVTCFQR